MALDESCAEPSGVKIKVLRDKKGGPSEFRIHNVNSDLSKLTVYLVDDCLIKDGQRCDYLVFPNEEAVVLVELKGSDVAGGLEQLAASIQALACYLEDKRKYAVLVPLRCPLAQSDIAIAQTKLKRESGCTLRVKNMKYECKTTDF